MGAQWRCLKAIWRVHPESNNIVLNFVFKALVRLSGSFKGRNEILIHVERHSYTGSCFKILLGLHWLLQTYLRLFINWHGCFALLSHFMWTPNRSDSTQLSLQPCTAYKAKATFESSQCLHASTSGSSSPGSDHCSVALHVCYDKHSYTKYNYCICKRDQNWEGGVVWQPNTQEEHNDFHHQAVVRIWAR